MAFPDRFLDELRARTSIAEVVGRRVDWDARKSNPAKGDYWACCPFHGEKTPSFHVEDRKGFFYCFGCQEKGDAIGFVMKMDRLPFHEAVAQLAGEAGLPMPERDPGAEARREKGDRLAEAMEAAQRFYRAQLSGAAAREARATLERRGLDAETIERFGIGYAPGASGATLAQLEQAGFTKAEAVEAGLAATRDDGSAYDRFRDRITFPIHDLRGRVIAFGGRAMSAEAPAKYLNSPETPLFSKGRVLYNHGSARDAVGKGGTLVIAEGYMDVIALHRAGVRAAVAPLGTALTEEQLTLAWRLSDEPVLALDGDAAGRRAAARAARLALPGLAPGRTLRFALMPEGQDPDDLLREGGRDALRAVLAAAEPLAEVLWQAEVDGQPLDTPERRAALDARLREVVRAIANEDVRRHYAAFFRERRAALFAPAVGAEGRPAPPRPGSAAPQRPARASAELRRTRLAGGRGEGLQALEARVLALALMGGEGADMEPRIEALEDAAFGAGILDSIRTALISAFADLAREGETVTPTRLLEDVRARARGEVAAALDGIARHAGRDGDGEALEGALARLRAERALEAERAEGGDDDEVAYRRRLAARRASETARRAHLYPAEGEGTVSVQGFVDRQVWRKRPKPRG